MKFHLTLPSLASAPRAPKARHPAHHGTPAVVGFFLS